MKPLDESVSATRAVQFSHRLLQKISTAVGVTAALLAIPAMAQQIVLYERANFSGRNVTVERNVQNLSYLGFENRASSVYVMSGEWEFCTEPYFQGNCRVYRPGEYRSLGNQSNRVSSVRLLSGGPGFGGSGNSNDNSWSNSGGALVELFDGQNFQGRLGTLRGPTPNFEPLGMNDKVASLIVRRGTWEFCTDSNYRNNCRVYGPGEYPQIWGGQDDQYSSARPVDGGWGNNRPGGQGSNNGQGGWGGSGGTPRVRFFEYSSFQGRSVWVRDAVSSFEHINFNDKAESMIVEGGSWRMCSDANGQGYCQVFHPGQYPVLPPGLRNTISSAYPR